nr:CopG family transcriptional regulator [Micromonospora sp. DSM 115978]
MDLTPYVEMLRRELFVAAEAAGPEAVALADRLTMPFDSAIRLTLLEALSAATAEITQDLAPGSVHLRLTGRDPDFVVALPPTDPTGPAAGEPSTEPEPAPEEVPAGGATTRINLRLPDDVKARVEEAAGRERISVNAWLVRAAVAALRPGRPATGHAGPSVGFSGSGAGQRLTGWAR